MRRSSRCTSSASARCSSLTARTPCLPGRTRSSRSCVWPLPAARRAAPRDRGGLLGVALFLPGVGVVVVAVPLPEAELVVVEELEAAQPLGALPEVALRDQETERIAVLELERPPVERVGQEDVIVVQNFERQVRGVALLGMGDDMRD